MSTSFSYKEFLDLISAGKIDDAFSYRAEFTPDYLYKYFWLSDNPENPDNQKRFDSLISNQLWFAVPIKQNDPGAHAPIISIISGNLCTRKDEFRWLPSPCCRALGKLSQLSLIPLRANPDNTNQETWTLLR